MWYPVLGEVLPLGRTFKHFMATCASGVGVLTRHSDLRRRDVVSVCVVDLYPAISATFNADEARC